MRKIAAVGINVRDGIVSHGLALNCNTDLDWFHQVEFDLIAFGVLNVFSRYYKPNIRNMKLILVRYVLSKSRRLEQSRHVVNVRS